ncbi:MAG: hypothetical protein QG666_1362, partial [Euryarchaeota archaeon]|nr:hypothetical protein [Euryarchaeota archaeon]
LRLGTHGADGKQNPLIMRIQFYMRNYMEILCNPKCNLKKRAGCLSGFVDP